MQHAIDMLNDVANGINRAPHKKGKCILAEFDGKPRWTQAGRITGFCSDLSFALNIRLKLVGIENHCILAYYRPIEYSPAIADFIRKSISEKLIFDMWDFYDLNRVIVYGKVFSKNGSYEEEPA